MFDITATGRKAAAYGRAKRTELAHGERPGKRIGTDRLEKGIAPQGGQSRAQDFVVVECQGRHGIEREPVGISGIVAATNGLRPHQSVKRHSNHPPARVTTGRRKRVELPHATTFKPRLLAQLAPDALFGALVHLHEAARKGPPPFERFSATLHQQHAEPRPVEPENHAGYL